MVRMTMLGAGCGAKPGQKVAVVGDGTQWVYNVSVVELEPKPLSKIAGWAARDRSALAERASGPVGPTRAAAAVALAGIEVERVENVQRGGSRGGGEWFGRRLDAEE